MNAWSMESQIAVMTSEPCLLTVASSAPSLLHVGQIRDGAGIGKVAPGEKAKELTMIKNAVKIATLRTRKYMAIRGRDSYKKRFLCLLTSSSRYGFFPMRCNDKQFDGYSSRTWTHYLPWEKWGREEGNQAKLEGKTKEQVKWIFKSKKRVASREEV